MRTLMRRGARRPLSAAGVPAALVLLLWLQRWLAHRGVMTHTNNNNVPRLRARANSGTKMAPPLVV